MIIFSKLWDVMASRGITTYILRERYNFDTQVIRRLRTNGNVTTATLNKLCRILSCNLEDIATYIPDEE